jgi:hypothetical protein
LAIAAQLLPASRCTVRMMRSSSAVHGPFLTSGSRWLCHLQKVADKLADKGRWTGWV